jgi:ParB-like chromosome segregation protein Spo0J
MKIRDRVIGLLKIPAKNIVPSPWNWRTHSKEQQQALLGILKEVGIAGAVLVRKLKNGKYMLIDGHLRRETLPNEKIPAVVLDVSEKEAKKLLLAVDPLAAMAGKDEEALQKLLKEVETEDESLASLFSNISTVKAEELELDLDDDGSAVPEGGEAEIKASHVRMVQLFLNVKTLPEFEKMVAALAPKYGTQTVTDTVIECLRRSTRVVKKSA